MSTETGSQARQGLEKRAAEIQDLTRQVAIRHLSSEDREGFCSFARSRVADDDYAILRKFLGASTWGTYLTVVVHRLLVDFRSHQVGEWPPSAALPPLAPPGCPPGLLANQQGLIGSAAPVRFTGSRR